MTKLKSRLIIGLAVLTLTTSAFADTKTDYDQAIQYAKENKVDDAIKLLETVSKSTDKLYVKKANYSLGAYYLSKQNYFKAKVYFLLAIGDENDVSAEAISSLYNLSGIAVEEKDDKMAEYYILRMKVRTKYNDPQVLEISGNYNLFVKNDLVKAEADFKKAASLSPKELKYQADLLELYEIKKDETSIASTISAMKVINSAVNNQEIAKYFESIKNYNLANKYFVKSVTEDKNEMSKLLLGVMYYNMGNKQDGKKLVQEAQKAGVKEADKVLEEIAKEEANK